MNLMKVLVINAGSSSVKYQLFDMTDESVLAKGVCERIAIEGGKFKHKVPGKPDYELSVDMANHREAIELIVKTLTSKEHGVISSMSEISAVGHRVLNGGESFSQSALINDDVIKAIEACKDLGPLHIPHNLTGIRACGEIMGEDCPQVAVFDTSFHQTMPDYAYLYALPYEYYEKYRIRRYGFHGTSHRYVSRRAAEVLGKDVKDLKIVTCHLGNGSSVAAVDGGKCVDTSMGLTPLEGIMMGTRCGSIDPAIIPFLMEKENMSAKEIDDMMNKKSGMLGVSQKTSDNRDISDAAAAGDKRCQLVENMLMHQLTKLIGGYAAVMGGVDAVVFTGGIGENNPHYRARIAKNLAFLGADIDEELNNRRGIEADLSKDPKNAKLHVMCIPTNEELVIARDTVSIVSDK